MAKNIDIPNGWEVKKLGEIGNFLKGKGIKKDELCDNGLPCVIYGQIYTSYDFYTDKFTSFIPINLKPYTTEIYQNDILFAGSGETKEEIGKSIAYIGKECAYAGGDIIILRQDKVISIFITYYLNSIGRKHLNRLGQGDSVVHIYKSILESVKIPVPPLAEQEKIAEILTLWDKAIEQTKELIAYKEKQKKGLMQNLLTGKKRLPGFTDKWKTTKLGEVVDKDIIYKKGQSLTAENANKGTIPVVAAGREIPYFHNNYNFKNIITISASGAYAGYIWYHNYPIWASDCNILYGQKDIFDTIFLFYILKLQQNKLYSLQTGGAQPHIYKNDICQLIIPKISFNEQKAIADILCKADEEIELLNQQLDLYTEQKKGLMQNLLTGKVRVTV